MNGSHGGNSSHTMSPKQAKRLMDDYNSAVCNLKISYEGLANNFFVALSKQWEDENAIKFSKEFKKRLDDYITYLSENVKGFCNNICELANAYARAGNVGVIVSAPSVKFSSGISVDCVKSEFVGEDKFGINDGASFDYLLDELKNFDKECIEVVEEITSRVCSSNAFGNEMIKRNLVDWGSLILDKWNREVGPHAVLYAMDQLNDYRSQYNKVTSTLTANPQINLGGSNSTGGNNSFGSYSGTSSADLGGSNSIGSSNGNALFASTTPAGLGGSNSTGSSNSSVSYSSNTSTVDEDGAFVTSGIGSTIKEKVSSFADDVVGLGKVAVKEPGLFVEALSHSVLENGEKLGRGLVGGVVGSVSGSTSTEYVSTGKLNPEIKEVYRALRK